jgi:hypothetical protein
MPQMSSRSFILLLLLLVLLVGACSQLPQQATDNLQPTSVGSGEPQSPPPQATVQVDPVSPLNRRIDDPKEYFFDQLLPFDAIRPVYDPEFVPAGEAPLDPDELILGVAWDGEAKAYPITVLRSREMVNDELAGIPTLVTW